MLRQPPQPTVTIYRVYHRGVFRLGLFFPIDNELKSIVRTLGAKWTRTHRCWYIDDSPEALKSVTTAFKGKAWVDYKEINSRLSFEELSHLRALYSSKFKDRTTTKGQAASQNDLKANPTLTYHPTIAQEVQRFEQLLSRRRYSTSTVKTYSTFFRQFVRFFHFKDPKEISEEEIVGYMNH